MKSQVREIAARSVALTQDGRDIELPNDSVIISAGGVLPTDFLRSIGIQIDTKYGTA